MIVCSTIKIVHVSICNNFEIVPNIVMVEIGHFYPYVILTNLETFKLGHFNKMK